MQIVIVLVLDLVLVILVCDWFVEIAADGVCNEEKKGDTEQYDYYQ